MDIKNREEWGPLATFVPNKRLPVYNWLYFKEGFSRDLVWNLLDLFGVSPGNWVLDPFCGSGTTMLACKERGINSMGIDALPVASLASRVKTRDYNAQELKDAATGIFGVKFEKVSFDFPYKQFFNKHVLEDVMLFFREIKRIDKNVRDFFLLSLITSAMRASWCWKDGKILKVKKRPSPPFRKFFKKRVMRMIREMEKIEGSGKVIVNPKAIQEESIDAVITSPPYLNQIDYFQVYRIENWFSGTRKAFAPYLGAERQGDYFKGMEQLLKELHRACKPGAKVGIVVGNAYFPKEDRIVEVDMKLGELAEQQGFQAKEIVVLNTRTALQRRTINRGQLRESLVVLEKNSF